MNGVVRDGDSFILVIDTQIYGLEAIKKTAYRFADVTSVIVQQRPDQKIAVVFNFDGVQRKADPDRIIADFCNELLDQDLREIIKRETTPVRNLILAHAFSRSSLTDNSES